MHVAAALMQCRAILMLLNRIPFQPVLCMYPDVIAQSLNVCACTCAGIPKDLLGLLDGRQTYVIDKSGVVKAIHNNQFDPESHVGEALAALGA